MHLTLFYSLLFLSSATTIVQRRDLIQQMLSSAWVMAKSLVLDYQHSQEMESERFAVTIKVWFGTQPTSPTHKVNLAPVIRVRNSQEKTRISSYRGMLSVGGVYHGSVAGLRSQITQLELDFPNGSPSSISAVCFSFGPDSVMSYQEPVCLPMSLMSYCREQYHERDHILPKSSGTGPRWIDFCDREECSRSLLIEDVAEFIYAFQSWEQDNAATANRLCRSISLTKPTNTIPADKFTCYTFFEEEKKSRVHLTSLPTSPDFKSKLFTKDVCPIGNFQLTAWADSLTSPDFLPLLIPHTGSSKW